MRTDEQDFSLDETAKRRSSAFTFDMGRFQTPATRAAMGSSQSGHERDRLFLNDERTRGTEFFADISGVSGLDSVTDGRSFCLLDYDRDGWLDVAEVSANRPMFQLFHNEVSGVLGDRAQGHRFLALRFEGGNRTANPSQEWTARDGFGARVELDLGDTKLLRVLSSNEGLAAQNSSTLVVGLGDHPVVARLTVTWPSGRRMSFENLAAGLLYTLHEDPTTGPTGTGLEIQSYLGTLPSVDVLEAPTAAAQANRRMLTIAAAHGKRPETGLVMYVGMQTECVACIRELSDVRRLGELLGDDLTLLGVPVGRFGWGPDDRADTPEALAAFLERHDPGYDLLVDLSPEEVAAYTTEIEERFEQNIYSTTILTDTSGHILDTRLGVPTLSEVRRLLDETRRGTR